MTARVSNSTNYFQLGLFLTWDNSVLEERLKCRGSPYEQDGERDAVGRSSALLEEVRRSNDVRLIHVKGHSADGGNDRADELGWWGKEGPPFCQLRLGGGEGASRHGPAANYEARADRRAEEKAAAARAAATMETLWRLHERPLRWEALRMRRKGVVAEPPS